MNFKNFKPLMMTILLVLTLTNYSYSETILVSYNKNSDFYFFDTTTFEKKDDLTLFKIISTHEVTPLLSAVVYLKDSEEDNYFKSSSRMFAATCENQEMMIIAETYYDDALEMGESVYASEEMGGIYKFEDYAGFPPVNALNYVCSYKVD